MNNLMSIIYERGIIMSLVDGKNAIPEGLGFRLALDMNAMKNFVNLPDDKRQQLVNYIQGSTTGDEAKNRVTEVVSNLHNGNTFS